MASSQSNRKPSFSIQTNNPVTPIFKQKPSFGPNGRPLKYNPYFQRGTVPSYQNTLNSINNSSLPHYNPSKRAFNQNITPQQQKRINYSVLYAPPFPRVITNPIVLYCIFRGYIFGPESRSAKVFVGQKAEIERDRNHKQDKSSLKVCVLQNREEPLGHCDVMTRDLLTELLDNRSFQAKAIVCDFDEEIDPPPQGQFVAQVKVYLFGPVFALPKVCEYLNRRIKQLDIDIHPYKLHPLFRLKTIEMEENEKYAEIFAEEERNADNKRFKVIDDSFASFEDVKGDFKKVFSDPTAHQNLQPEEPPVIIKTPLLKHQKIGLRWMVLREKKKKDKSLFWKKCQETGQDTPYWQNELTGTKISQPPEEFRGGILADDMGLGKTIQAISLIASSGFGNGPTLIICPVSVMITWRYQIEEHAVNNSFRVIIYHGSSRNTDTESIEDFDIVITSYSVVTNEFSLFGPAPKLESETKIKTRKAPNFQRDISDESSDENSTFEYTKGIHSVHWLRIILDEAHKIRSRKSKKHKAICSLKADRRWCLTGTPLQNRLDDLYALIKFLRVHPLVDFRFWRKVILDPLKIQSSEGLKRLWTLREYILLRRTKKSKIDGKPIVSLPEKIFRDIKLDFGEENQKMYKRLSEMARQSIRRTEASFGTSNVFVFAIITRLRQFCCHPQLLPDNYGAQIALESNLPASFSSVQEAFEEILDGETICFICKNPARNPCVTNCFHVFCKTCLTEDLQSNRCPICGKRVDYTKLLEPQKQAPQLQNNQDEPTKPPTVSVRARIKGEIRRNTLRSSAKVDWLLRELRTPFDMSGRKDKSVVFSQWVTMLDVIEYNLELAGIASTRIDGAKTPQMRDLAYRSFQNDDDVSVILISLGAGGEGINLTAANRVFLMDPWWNPATEDQAVDRVHRLGQKRDVQINRLFMKNSVEEKVQDLQYRKRCLAESTLGKERSITETRILLSEIKDLFK